MLPGRAGEALRKPEKTLRHQLAGEKGIHYNDFCLILTWSDHAKPFPLFGGSIWGGLRCPHKCFPAVSGKDFEEDGGNADA
jgi:hypothetical protein